MQTPKHTFVVVDGYGQIVSRESRELDPALVLHYRLRTQENSLLGQGRGCVNTARPTLLRAYDSSTLMT